MRTILALKLLLLSNNAIEKLPEKKYLNLDQESFNKINSRDIRI